MNCCRCTVSTCTSCKCGKASQPCSNCASSKCRNCYPSQKAALLPLTQMQLPATGTEPASSETTEENDSGEQAGTLLRW